MIQFVPVLYFRYLYTTISYSDTQALLWGSLSDLFTTFLFSLFSCSVSVFSKRKGTSVAFTLCWWLYYAVVIGYFQAMNVIPALEQARYLVDLHFLSASLNAQSALALLVGLSVLLAVLYKLPLKPLLFKKGLWAGLLVLVSLIAVPQLRVDGNPLWVQISTYLMSAGEDKRLQGTLNLGHDLSGALTIPASTKKPNVLVVVMEGIPGGYLPQNVALTQASADFTMPKLAKWASRGLLVPNFITHRNQTINGLYSLLCADYPRLFDGTLVVQELLAQPPSSSDLFMPEILAQSGYSTTYLQAAELRFMDKDRFMKLLGFQEVLGEEWFSRKKGTFFSRWGINDQDFFVQGLDKIRELRKRGKPWFMTMLTVGTHHPYTLPPQWNESLSLPEKQRSVKFLDQAIDKFLSRLQKEGILKDTLVIITSDESHGMNSDILLAGNWGLCLALTPTTGKKPATNPGLFGLVDIPLSILDYLGLGASADHIAGRSIFRDYMNSAPRPLAGSWGSRLFVVSDDQLLLRDFGSEEFMKFNLSGASPFSISNHAEGELFAGSTGILRQAVRLSEKNAKPEVYNLLPESSLLTVPDVRPQNTHTWLSGGQYIQVNKGEHFKLDLNLSAPLENKRPIWLDFMFYRLDGTFLPFLSKGLLQMPFLQPGETLHLSLTLAIKEDLMLDSFRLAGWSPLDKKGKGTVKNTPQSLKINAFTLKRLPGKPSGTGNNQTVVYTSADAQITLNAFVLTSAQGTNLPYQTSEGSIYGGSFFYIPLSPQERGLTGSVLFGEGFDTDNSALANHAVIYFQNQKTSETKLNIELNRYPASKDAGVFPYELTLNGYLLQNPPAPNTEKANYILASPDLKAGWNTLELKNLAPLSPFEDESEFADWNKIKLKTIEIK